MCCKYFSKLCWLQKTELTFSKVSEKNQHTRSLVQSDLWNEWIGRHKNYMLSEHYKCCGIVFLSQDPQFFLRFLNVTLLDGQILHQALVFLKQCLVPFDEGFNHGVFRISKKACNGKQGGLCYTWKTHIRVMFSLFWYFCATLYFWWLFKSSLWKMSCGSFCESKGKKSKDVFVKSPPK